MKRLTISVIVMIIAILLGACALTDSPAATSTPQIPDTNKISPQASPTEATNTVKNPAPSPAISAELTTETPSPVPSPAISAELTTDDLKYYLDLKMSEVLETYDAEMGPGTLAVMESHMVFPCAFVESLGLTFIFPDDFDDLKPIYINVGGESYLENISIKGANPGMDFSEIMDKLNSPVTETWIANEDCVYYQIVYKMDGLVYQFVSYDEEGTAVELYISRDW